jgi:hypothetical protein
MKPTARKPSPDFREEVVEDAIGRIHEALAILDAIESGDLLAELPADRRAARRHQCAVSLLTILRRELEAAANELSSAQFVADAIGQLSRPEPPA